VWTHKILGPKRNNSFCMGNTLLKKSSKASTFGGLVWVPKSSICERAINALFSFHEWVQLVGMLSSASAGGSVGRLDHLGSTDTESIPCCNTVRVILYSLLQTS